ncbi:hypothetical protein GIB67_022324 [Kingdonia uniflora]|uniref:Integrase catalytic domain-containing protein n=1 Tax=Kingdonia uniflora TaxID=39325 RepID=A0A7J7KWE6_9MAGN|nr:hypothetical protein GIB67_022324 [Kingdonia uniflora]
MTLKGTLMGPYLVLLVHSPPPTPLSIRRIYSGKKKDHILLGWLLSSLSRTTLAQVVGLSTSRAIWDALQKHYASKARARIMQLRRELQTMHKGSKPMKDYFLHAKELTDSLAASGHPMSDSDLQQIILSGLDNAYDAIVTMLTTTMADITMDDFYAHLIAFDMRLEAQTVMLEQHPVANVATQQRNMSLKPGFNHNQNRNCSYNGNQYRNCGQSMNRFPNRSQPVQSVVGPCLICGRKNHTAQICWYRSDQMSQAAPSPPTTYVAAPGSFANHNWIPDSGATHHLTPNFNNFHLQAEYDGPDQIRVDNGTNLPIENIGTASFSHNSRKFYLQRVYHVPKLFANLLLVSQFSIYNNVFFKFHPHLFVVKDCRTRKVLLNGRNRGGLYTFDHACDLQNPVSSSAFLSVSLPVWHQRLGHPMIRIVNKVISSNSLPVSSKSFSFCHSCHVSKSQKLSFPLSSTLCNGPLDLIVSDLWGLSPILSKDGFRYYLLLMDVHTHYTWIYSLARNSDALSFFITFKNKIEKLTGHKIKIFQSDNGGKFKKFTPYLDSHCIFHRFSCPHTAEQNGLAERRHKHIVETGLSLFNHASVPLSFWFESFTTTCFLINRLPSSVSTKQSPLELLFGTKPDYHSFRMFGCLCYPYLRPYSPHKLAYRSLPCVFIDYCSAYKGYLCYHRPTHRVYISRHVRFEESTFPFLDVNNSPSTRPEISSLSTFVLSPPPQLLKSTSAHVRHYDPPGIPPSPSLSPSLHDLASPPLSPFLPDLPTPETTSPVALSHIPEPTSSASTPILDPPQPPIIPDSVDQHHMITRARDEIFKPLTKMSLMATKYPLQVDDIKEPTCFTQASPNPNWRRVLWMMNSMRSSKTKCGHSYHYNHI